MITTSNLLGGKNMKLQFRGFKLRDETVIGFDNSICRDRNIRTEAALYAFIQEEYGSTLTEEELEKHLYAKKKKKVKVTPVYDRIS
jgi:hypothetical protein